MKNILSFLKLIASYVGLSNLITSLKPKSIEVLYLTGSMQASVTISFDDISIIGKDILSMLIAWLDSHESVVSITVSGNNIVALIYV